MLIYINDQPETLDFSTCLLQELLSNVRHNHPKGVAVAVNGEVISRSAWPSFTINENDRITLIQATQGG